MISDAGSPGGLSLLGGRWWTGLTSGIVLLPDVAGVRRCVLALLGVGPERALSAWSW